MSTIFPYLVSVETRVFEITKVQLKIRRKVHPGIAKSAKYPKVAQCIFLTLHECNYLKNKVGVVDFTKARELVKLPILGHLKNLLLPLYF